MAGRNFSLLADAPHSVLLAAAADAAGRTSRYASLKNALKAYVLVEVNQGNAATVALTVLQATNVSGAGSAVVNAMPIALVDATGTTDAFVVQTPAANFTTDATLADKLVLFEILPEAVLNVAGGYDCIAIQTGASNAANVTRAELVIIPAVHAIGASQPSTFNN